MSIPDTTARRPLPGRDCPAVLVMEHSLVRVRAARQLPEGLVDGAEALWRALADSDRPVAVWEAAMRQALPVGVAKVLVSELVHTGLAELSDPRPDRALLEATAAGPSSEGVGAGLDVVKLVVAGGPLAGKTTLLGAVSQIPPVAVGERLPAPGGRVITTVREWGRLPLGGGVQVVLAAARVHGGVRPTWWDDLGLWRGASGTVVLAHPARLEESCPAVDWLEEQGLPYAVAVNTVDGAVLPDTSWVREMLQINDGVPVVLLDARSPESVRLLLRDTLRHAARTLAGGVR
ncbi:DUF742 domain-containing protein [Thermobifida halotolerans]|uniref:DUF742 domain-containing protein n=1 Tax=Thermobifida halotolerans TaxID=483545 RepID=A0AA97M0I3_9ACTN|nr:DUF742 domain-containing protein [Thermobifida halotolerans]UOE21391.1 DUF742 domain-containing protein [Thermobifida halotolerans]